MIYAQRIDISLRRKTEGKWRNGRKGFRGDSSIYRPVRVIDTELRSFGLEATLVKKKKLAESTTESAFIKASTLKQILMIGSKTKGEIAMPENQVTKVKFGIDIDPPEAAVTEVEYIDTPVPFALRVYDLPSLFSGKMHALLARAWKTRVKGRDWYDFVFYITRGVPLSLSHLEARLRQTGHYTDSSALSQNGIKEMLERKIESTDFEAAKRDVEPFILRPQDLTSGAKIFSFIWHSASSFNKIIEPTMTCQRRVLHGTTRMPLNVNCSMPS